MTTEPRHEPTEPILPADERSRIATDRINAIRELLAAKNARGIVLEARRDFAWLTVGGQNHILYATEKGVAPVLVTLDDAVVLAPVNDYDRIADEEISGLPLRLERTPWWPTDPANLLKADDIADELESLRTSLTSREHERMVWLAGIVTRTVDEILGTVSAGTNEDDVIATTQAAFAALGVRLPVVLISADERIVKYRHPLSASRPIRDAVMLVVCAERWGLIVAHTQFVHLSGRDAAVQRAADATATVLSRMRDATIAGNTLEDVLDAAKRAYADEGMPDEWTLHHQGGSIGYQARERIAVPGDRTPIRPGMAFAWNPSAPGFKREETLYLDAEGNQHILTTTPG